MNYKCPCCGFYTFKQKPAGSYDICPVCFGEDDMIQLENMYTENQLVKIAKRENNKKRNYLVVNKIQGKHIPVIPSKAFAMFKELAELLKKEYFNERLLLVGFAETATAIGASVASFLNCNYIQTTREQVSNVEYLFFSETHSHATEQKLVKDDIDAVIDKIDRIVFIEDEVTTGNTIRNIIDILEDTYQKGIKFSVASLLNGMSREAEQNYQAKSIQMHYLVKTNHAEYEKKAEKYKGDGFYYKEEDYKKEAFQLNLDEWIQNHCITCSGYLNARRIVNSKEYEDSCALLWEQIKNKLLLRERRILVLGTEEFMYPALYVALQIEKEIGCKCDSESEVRFHATTRSPIIVSREQEYPFHERYQLKSLYDKKRTTYLYDLKDYERVIVITDAPADEKEGLYSLLLALRKSGNQKIDIVRWC